MRGLFWTAVQFAAAMLWLSYAVWLNGRFPPLVAGVLAVAPGLLLIGGFLGLYVVLKKRDRRRLLDEEFRE